jgi:hypothetical protein
MDEQETSRSTRRGALARLLGIAAGAAGLGAFAGSKASAAESGTPSDAADLTLYVPHLRQKQVGPDGAAAWLPFGEVVDRKGRPLGSLHAAKVDSTQGALTLHTFELAQGTIVGVAVGSSTYAVIGSTGAYAGLAGSYIDRPATRLPGRQYSFTLREGR